ncbi:MAG: hypothetical protein JWL70_898 [Acidimicrobiia bacterium]|nr:hypothetical protein [Acidimicrobiia bacterium]
MAEASVMGTRINVDDTFVTITRRLPRSEHRIPLAQVSAVQFQPAGITTPGTLHVVVAGDEANPDDTTVEFQLRHKAEFETVRAAIEARMGGSATAE